MIDPDRSRGMGRLLSMQMKRSRLCSATGIPIVPRNDMQRRRAQGVHDRITGQLNGCQLGGRTLTVNEARPKPEYAGSGFGGGRGSGGRREPRW